MSETSRAPSFSLPYLSRVNTRLRETNPSWSQHLAMSAFVALITLALLGPWMTVNNENTQNAIRQAGYGAILVLALIATRPWQHPERLLVVPWPILMVLAWCWLSTLWMIDPSVGIRRLVLTTIIAWSLFALVRQLGPERTVSILRTMLAIMLMVNFVFAVFYPEIGRDSGGGEGLTGTWRGLMGQKNFAGVPCAMAILFFLFDTGRVHWIVRIAVCAGAVIFLVMSESKTSMGICAASVVAGVVFGLLAKRLGQRQLALPALSWLLLVGPVLIFVSMAIDNVPYLALVSDPAAFTGRTQIWAALIKAYADRPWLGVGYGSFWDLGPAGPIFKYATGWVTNMSEGHDGYLDLLVQIGGIGTLLALYATLVWPARRLLYGGDHPARTLAAALVVFSFGHNFTESTLFDRDALVQVFLMVAIALLWAVTAAPVGGSTTAIPARPAKPIRPRAPLRL
ncbi:O-antigen ligase [Novosphingobium sp. CF614]|uniref:O-antigen ligase family protein n=1 Tax=Novosphingobium sp. CF614 TaxID=1884364 RepID=UPI0008F3F42A|nr:O-antigen ligase family protein [Novosphingobium sp. CF614]SFG20252.1 O-antigen ligase [Novosphingobium sp. CF614]